MADRIYITNSDFHDLRALIERHAEGRDGLAAKRLAGELERALVVDLQELPPDAVTIRSRVTFKRSHLRDSDSSASNSRLAEWRVQLPTPVYPEQFEGCSVGL